MFKKGDFVVLRGNYKEIAKTSRQIECLSNLNYEISCGRIKPGNLIAVDFTSSEYGYMHTKDLFGTNKTSHWLLMDFFIKVDKITKTTRDKIDGSNIVIRNNRVTIDKDDKSYLLVNEKYYLKLKRL
jgi:hypothetical protein